MKYYSTSADNNNNNNFTKKSSAAYFMDNSKNELLMELEEKNKTVLMLTSLLQKVRLSWVEILYAGNILIWKVLMHVNLSL